MAKFEIGATYRAYGNYDNYYDFKVIARTAKTITFETGEGKYKEQKRAKVQNFFNDHESVSIKCFILEADEKVA